MSVASCYDLTLTCDSPQCYERHRAAGIAFPNQRRMDTYTGEHGASCRRAARTSGWRFDDAAGWAYCRFCAADAPAKRRR